MLAKAYETMPTDQQEQFPQAEFFGDDFVPQQGHHQRNDSDLSRKYFGNTMTSVKSADNLRIQSSISPERPIDPRFKTSYRYAVIQSQLRNNFLGENSGTKGSLQTCS